MIRALSRDALRQLLRGQAFWLIVAVGGLIGLFVRATRATGSDHLVSEDPHGDAIDTWIAGLFLASLIQAVVAGLLLATEDRETGLLQQVAIRPVPRLRYAAGRILGLTLGVASALLLLTVISAPLSGLSRKDLPEIRDLLRLVLRPIADRHDLDIGHARPSFVLEAAEIASADTDTFQFLTHEVEAFSSF